MTYVTYRLTAKNRDQLRNPTLGNRVWATVLIKKIPRYHGFPADYRGITAVLSPLQLSIADAVDVHSGDTSIWVLVVFTLDRFAAICFPLRRRHWWQPRRARYYALAAFLLATAKNFAVFWTRGAEYLAANDTANTAPVLLSNCGRPTAAYRCNSTHSD